MKGRLIFIRHTGILATREMTMKVIRAEATTINATVTTIPMKLSMLLVPQDLSATIREGVIRP
jgi:hypothetical protein